MDTQDLGWAGSFSIGSESCSWQGYRETLGPSPCFTDEAMRLRAGTTPAYRFPSVVLSLAQRDLGEDQAEIPKGSIDMLWAQVQALKGTLM